MDCPICGNKYLSNNCPHSGINLIALIDTLKRGLADTNTRMLEASAVMGQEAKDKLERAVNCWQEDDHKLTAAEVEISELRAAIGWLESDTKMDAAKIGDLERRLRRTVEERDEARRWARKMYERAVKTEHKYLSVLANGLQELLKGFKKGEQE